MNSPIPEIILVKISLGLLAAAAVLLFIFVMWWISKP